MTIEAIAPIVAEALSATREPVAPKPADFAHWMTEQIQDVNSKIIDAQTGLRQLATGETGNLHQVMLQIEEAKLAFQLTTQIRNKVLEGYQDIMRMQI
jgi:flagellar hook-basal body complex protein FliE